MEIEQDENSEDEWEDIDDDFKEPSEALKRATKHVENTLKKKITFAPKAFNPSDWSLDNFEIGKPLS